jgi:hypothetical protein
LYFGKRNFGGKKILCKEGYLQPKMEGFFMDLTVKLTVKLNRLPLPCRITVLQPAPACSEI